VPSAASSCVCELIVECADAGGLQRILNHLRDQPTVDNVTDAAPHIGTLRDKQLYASPRMWYARPQFLRA